MTHPAFTIIRSKDDEFHFNLTAKNAQVILTSQQYTTKAACVKGLESVKSNANDEGHFEKKEAKDGRYYFVVKAANQQVIGNSQMYTTESARDNGIKSVMDNAPSAAVVDETKE